MKTPIWILVLATALAAAPVAAQEPSQGPLASAVMKVLGLPKATQEARVLGVPEPDIRTVLEAARQKGVSGAIVTEVIEGENQAIREHGPIDNFGAFVQARLDEGLRGRDLAAAIRAEHAARGKGKGHAKGMGGDAEMGGKKGAAAGAGGKPEGVGKGGKPDSPGKSESQDKPGADKGKKGGSR